MSDRIPVQGVTAPAPRPTLWLAFLLATGLSILFLIGLGVWTMIWG